MTSIEHGVGIVDHSGVACLCGWERLYSNGGFPALNEHLRSALGELEGAWAAVEQALPEGWVFVELQVYGSMSGPRVFARARLSSGFALGNEAHGRGATPLEALRALVVDIDGR